jgi:hypothetical protein
MQEATVAKAQAGLKSTMRRLNRNLAQRGLSPVVIVILFALFCFFCVFLLSKFQRWCWCVHAHIRALGAVDICNIPWEKVFLVLEGSTSSWWMFQFVYNHKWNHRMIKPVSAMKLQDVGLLNFFSVILIHIQNSSAFCAVSSHSCSIWSCGTWLGYRLDLIATRQTFSF